MPRGEPDRAKAFGDTLGPVVWETWKSANELFPVDPRVTPPTPWDNIGEYLAVRLPDQERKLKLFALPSVRGQQAKPLRIIGEVLKDAIQVSLPPKGQKGPLIAQNHAITRYEIRMNQISYQFIFNNMYYIRDKLTQVATESHSEKVDLLLGSINIKASWILLPQDPNIQNRFYRISAHVVDWNDKGQMILVPQTMGLVGLHIVYKTRIGRIISGQHSSTSITLSLPVVPDPPHLPATIRPSALTRTLRIPPTTGKCGWLLGSHTRQISQLQRLPGTLESTLPPSRSTPVIKITARFATRYGGIINLSGLSGRRPRATAIPLVIVCRLSSPILRWKHISNKCHAWSAILLHHLRIWYFILLYEVS
jgi:hypothetical protein